MSTETSKKQILQEKVTNLLDRSQSRNAGILERIERDNGLLTDFVLPLNVSSPLTFEANGSIKMNFNDQQYSLHHNALMQLAEKFGVPQRYLKELASTDWGRKLAQQVLTDHKNNIARQRVLIRTVGDQARAVLSDKYRRLNSDKIYTSFIEESRNAGAQLYEAEHTDTKSYISTIIPQVFEIPTENNGLVHSVFGARIANSDYGDGALEVRAFQMNCVCLNGMVSESQLKQIHLGKRLPDNVSFSDNTYRLDTAAMASAVGDIMKNVLSVERIKESAAAIKAASGELIDLDTEIKKLPRMGMLKSEVEQVEKRLMNSDEAQGITGKPTRWKLSQAITSVSNEIGERRRQELNELAGQLISL